MSLRLLLRLVGEDDDPRTQRLRLDEFQVHRPPTYNEPLAGPQDQRIAHDPILVDEAMLGQDADEISAAIDQNVQAGLLLQLGDRIRDIAAYQVRIFPLSRLERPRDDVLRQV